MKNFSKETLLLFFYNVRKNLKVMHGCHWEWHLLSLWNFWSCTWDSFVKRGFKINLISRKEIYWQIQQTNHIKISTAHSKRRSQKFTEVNGKQEITFRAWESKEMKSKKMKSACGRKDNKAHVWRQNERRRRKIKRFIWLRQMCTHKCQ